MVQEIKRELKTWRGRLILSIGILLLTLFALLKMEIITAAKPADHKIRSIELEIRDMAFAGDNPTISLQPGETVRFIIINSDPGMKHEFNIQGTEVRSRILNFGERDAVIFKVPLEQKRLVYFCAMHALTMWGNLDINSAAVPGAKIAAKSS